MDHSTNRNLKPKTIKKEKEKEKKDGYADAGSSLSKLSSQ